ncbi:MAG: FkbM family methyltransferase [Hyphomicrobiales bacterium]|nr:FkbM family methyltransferase [Hyphomicrobiales bacterium]
MPKTTSNDLSPFGHYAPQPFLKRILKWTRAASADWAGMRRAFVLRAMGLRALGGKPVDTEALGAWMRLYPYNNVCEKRILFTPQYFDPAERDLLASRITPDFTFIDVGANIGGYALFVAAHAGPRARVLAVEPQPEIFERLVYNIRQNPFATVKAIDCALADEDGEITLFLPRHNRGESSMRIVHAESDGTRIRVPARTMLSVVEAEGYERIDALKLDVEGAEDLILEPYLRHAPQALWPALILMQHTHGRWAIDLPALMAERGYREVLRTRQNVAYVRG